MLLDHRRHHTFSDVSERGGVRFIHTHTLGGAVFVLQFNVVGSSVPKEGLRFYIIVCLCFAGRECRSVSS